MRETPEELNDLQALLDASLARATPHLRSIVGGRTITAKQLTDILTGMCPLALSTVTAKGEPRISGVDGHFLHGKWYFGTARSAAKARHLAARPVASAAHMRGEDLGVFTHGTVEILNPEQADPLRTGQSYSRTPRLLRPRRLRLGEGGRLLPAAPALDDRSRSRPPEAPHHLSQRGWRPTSPRLRKTVPSDALNATPIDRRYEVATTIDEGFEQFLRKLTPTEAEQAAAARHSAELQRELSARFPVERFWQTGSFDNGTAVHRYSAVDYFALISWQRPGDSTLALTAIRDALKERFPSARIRADRPAVVVEFSDLNYDIIPAFQAGAEFVCYIPDRLAGGSRRAQTHTRHT